MPVGIIVFVLSNTNSQIVANVFVYDLCDLESEGFSVVANQLIKDIDLN